MAELQKTLSFPVILIITINSIMGTGIFFLPALGAAKAGPTSIISWILMAILSMGVSLVFAELVGMFPKAGGVYEYSKQAFGPLTSFLIGWMTMVAANITIAMLVVGAVQYLSPTLSMFFKILISIGFILAFNFMAYKGMKTSAVMLVVFGIVTMFTLLSLIIPGLFTFDVANLTPFFTHPMSITFLAIFFIAETFFGWETATFLAEETKDAKKVMPRAMWIGTLCICVMVLAFVIVSLGNIPWAEFGKSAAPLSDLAGIFYGAKSMQVMSLLVYLSIIGSVAGWVVSAPRLVMSLAEDKMFIPQLADIHPKNNTPYKAIAFQTVLTSILVVIGAGSYEVLLHLLLPIVLVLYAAVILAFVVLRIKNAIAERPFKVWFGVPLGIFLITCLCALIAMWLILDHTALNTLRLAFGFAFLGVPVFFLLTFYYNPDAIVTVTESFARLNLLFESFILPRRIRKEIMMTLPTLEGKKVLDFGAGVGTMSKHMAKHGATEIVATDMSARNIKILGKRLKRRKIKYTLIHDPHQVSRVHPDIPFVDVAVSVGMISYIQDLKRVLEELHRLLPDRGTVCFVEYVDFFWLLPNAGWLKDEKKLIDLFYECGFRVELVKMRGLFWRYMFIYGKKTMSDDRVYI